MATYSQRFDYLCGSCGNAGLQDVWLVVDGAERPDLVQAMAGGAVTRFACAACRAPVELNGSLNLLVCRPNLRPALLFASAEALSVKVELDTP